MDFEVQYGYERLRRREYKALRVRYSCDTRIHSQENFPEVIEVLRTGNGTSTLSTTTGIARIVKKNKKKTVLPDDSWIETKGK